MLRYPTEETEEASASAVASSAAAALASARFHRSMRFLDFEVGLSSEMYRVEKEPGVISRRISLIRPKSIKQLSFGF